MQFKLSLGLLALATFVAANPLERRQAADPNAAPAAGPYAPAPPPPTVNNCNTGNLQCCQSVSSAASPPAAQLLGILGIAAQGVDALVGLTCTPLTVIGLQSGSCTAQPVCCSNDNFNGVVALGCSPINAGL